jgi:hypothetical protein
MKLDKPRFVAHIKKLSRFEGSASAAEDAEDVPKPKKKSSKPTAAEKPEKNASAKAPARATRSSKK